MTKTRIEIYKLRHEGDDWVIDGRRLVAVITIRGDRRRYRIRDKRYEKLLHQLFDWPAVSFTGGGRTPDGVWVDAAVQYPAWTREAIELTVSQRLYGSTLGGRIIDGK